MSRWLEQWSKLENKHEETLWHWIQPLTPEDFFGKTVLDAGCGNGGNAAILSQYAKHITGVDLESTKSPLLEIRDNISYEKGDLENLNRNNEFDISLSIGVLHHLSSPEKGFDNIVKSTKLGGIVAVWVYSREGNFLMWAILEPLKRKFFLRMPQWLFNFSALFCTLLGYSLAYSPFYLLSISFLPYNKYFRHWRKYGFRRNYMNVYDKLNAPLTHFISSEEIQKWGTKLGNTKITDFNGVSWSLVGEKTPHT